ncbi:MAG TPA: DUF3089 domain-containing protein [Sphingomonas sp.]|jgi:hypothetical protein|uniref:DUF3089 domain-containing protein n=1 Tax=Sphingomonas sp. TaxID=28214 RepID=UPI002EDABB5C
MARKFLYVVATLIVLAIASAFAYRLFGNDIIRAALVPGGAFRAQPGMEARAYADPKMWVARPDLPGNPALWLPPGYSMPASRPRASMFFIHPTSYVSRDAWNGTVAGDAETNFRTNVFVRGQASAFNAVADIYAPRYRQATFGAFLTSEADAQRALALAYRDVAAAFDAFLAQVAPDRPIILAGHSQGALHLTTLLREKVATDPALRRRVVAAYVVGWPVSRTTDLTALGLPECRAAAQAGCVLSWQSFGEPADPSLVVDTYDATTGFDGRSRRGTPMVCTNPLTGTPDAAAPVTANLGTLVPSTDLSTASLVPNAVPARCDRARGVLLIGDPPEVGQYVLPGNNYHVYDYSLFWSNVRADAARRLAAFEAR